MTKTLPTNKKRVTTATTILPDLPLDVEGFFMHGDDDGELILTQMDTL